MIEDHTAVMTAVIITNVDMRFQTLGSRKESVRHRHIECELSLQIRPQQSLVRQGNEPSVV